MKTNTRTLRAVLFCFFALCALTLCATCPRCGGKGRIQTQYSVSSYGIRTDKKRCSYCGKMIMANEAHWDPCPVCHGNKDYGRSGRRSSSSSTADRANDLLSYLSPAEAVQLKNLQQELFRGKMVTKQCETCKGTGDCIVCGGYHNLNLDDAAYQRCIACGGDGFCIRCRGKGNFGTTYEPWSPAERERLESQIRVLMGKATQAMGGGSVSSGDLALASGGGGGGTTSSYYSGGGDVSDAGGGSTGNYSSDDYAGETNVTTYSNSNDNAANEQQNIVQAVDRAKKAKHKRRLFFGILMLGIGSLSLIGLAAFFLLRKK